jgi:hypothetical protein
MVVNRFVPARTSGETVSRTMAQPLEPGDQQNAAQRGGEVDSLSALHGQRQQMGRHRQSTPRQN